MYWLGGVGEAKDAEEGTDFHALKTGYVSVTPLHIDLTHYAEKDWISEWLSEIHK